MKYRYPIYYRQFRCAAGDCPDTCCGGWNIGIDEKTWQKYQKRKGPYGAWLRNGVNHGARIYHLRNRRCVFLDREGLCGIQRELGEEWMCRACRRYPRHMEDYGDLQEYLLSLSCPQAARLILTDTSGGRLLERESPRQREPWKDKGLLRFLEQVRAGVCVLLREKRLSWEERLAMVLALTHDLQRHLDRHDPDGARQVLSRYVDGRGPERFVKTLAPFRNRDRECLIRRTALLRETGMLVSIVPEWSRRQKRLCSRLYHEMDLETSAASPVFFRESEELCLAWENLALYLVQTFFLGAVYDRDLYTMGKFLVCSLLVIGENHRLRLAEEPAQDPLASLISACYQYSRVVENSDENLETLTRALRENPLYHLESLLVMLQTDRGKA